MRRYSSSDMFQTVMADPTVTAHARHNGSSSAASKVMSYSALFGYYLPASGVMQTL